MTITWEQANQRLERAARLLNDADPAPGPGPFHVGIDLGTVSGLYRAVGCGKGTYNGRQSRGLNTTNLKGQFKKGGDRTFSEKWRGTSGSHSP